MFKVTSILIVVLLSVQGLDIKPINLDEIDQLELNSIADKVAEALKKLKHAVDTVVQTSVGLLEGIESSLDSTAKFLLEKTEEEIQKEAKKLNDMMNQIIEKAVGENITKCLEEFQPKLIQLPIDLTKNLEQCVDNQLVKGQAIVNTTLDEINNVYLKISNLEEEVKDCDGSKRCLAGLVIKITLDVTVLPAEITANIAKAQLLLGTCIPSMNLCAAGQAAKLTLDGGIILAELAECVITA